MNEPPSIQHALARFRSDLRRSNACAQAHATAPGGADHTRCPWYGSTAARPLERCGCHHPRLVRSR